MFDRYDIHPSETRYVSTGPSRVDHHEHRAPTDESVRLLKEMEEAALGKIIASIPVEDNEMKGHMILSDDMMRYELHAIFIFKINGMEHTAKVSHHRSKPIIDLLIKLRDETARIISGSVLEKAFVDFNRNTPIPLNRM